MAGCPVPRPNPRAGDAEDPKPLLPLPEADDPKPDADDPEGPNADDPLLWGLPLLLLLPAASFPSASTRIRESEASDVVNRTGCIVSAIPLNASPTSELSPNIPSSRPTRSWLSVRAVAASLRTS